MTTATAIAAWLPRARWFAGKHDGMQVEIRDAAPVAGTSITLALVDVRSAGEEHRYVVPLAADADAALAPDFAAWVVEAAFRGTTLAAEHGTFRGHRVVVRDDAPAFARAGALVTPLGGDASNTSLLVSSGPWKVAVKLLRRCRTGIQPEVEVGAFLSRDAAWEGTPRLHGWIDYVTPSGESTVIATVHEFAAGCASAWDHFISLMMTGGLSGRAREPVLEGVATLGRATAEMHRALASRSDLPAFAPVGPTVADMQAEARQMTDHAGAVFDRAAASLDRFQPSIATVVRAVLARRDEIVASLRRIAEIAPAARHIRVHGDYHLGQVLIREPRGEALVIDFEGEPGRSLAERRRKTSVFKDIAGMCRSFDYLLRHVSRVGGPAYRTDELRVLEATFLDAYRAVAEGHAWWPDDAATADALRAVYTLDKAVYELAYELANRPDWIEVPLAALV